MEQYIISFHIYYIMTEEMRFNSCRRGGGDSFLISTQRFLSSTLHKPQWKRWINSITVTRYLTVVLITGPARLVDSFLQVFPYLGLSSLLKKIVFVTNSYIDSTRDFRRVREIEESNY